MSITFHKLILALCAFCVAGCAATAIQVPRLKPAEVNLGPVKKVAIGQIEGDGGEDVSDKLTEAIMATGKYEVLDRQHLAEIAKEKQIAAGDPSSAYGKVLGAAALIFGRVTQNSFQDQVAAEEKVCIQGSRSFPCTTYTRAGKHTTAVNFKIVDAATGKVLASQTVTGAATDRREVQTSEAKVTDPKAAARIIPPFEDLNNFRQVAIGDVVTLFMRLIAPYTVSVRVVLFEQSECPTSKAGVAAAKTGDWATSISQFKAAVAVADSLADSKVMARAHYNLGVALGYSGSYRQGIAEIQKAIEVQAEDEFPEQVAAIRGFEADDARLRAQTNP